MSTGYFHRVTHETLTRFWINNPTENESERALAAGAISCTTNPTYAARLLQQEPDTMRPLLQRVIGETHDDTTTADHIVQQVTAPLLARFLPLYERSGGKQGFVTIQSDPRQDEDSRELIEAALRYRTLSPNFMAKIPVTAAGLEAMESLIAENIPLCATEVFSLDQTMAMCELYQRVAQRTGCYPPCYVTHITGIFDEYLRQSVAREGIAISSEALHWAGGTVARKAYRWLKEGGFPITMLGGGARAAHHFTDFVGGDFHITINWSTAQELLEANPPVVPQIERETPPSLLAELLEKLPDFRRAYETDILPIAEFSEYGPVQFFRNNFIAGYERLLTEIAAHRQSAATEGTPAR